MILLVCHYPSQQNEYHRNAFFSESVCISSESIFFYRTPHTHSNIILYAVIFAAIQLWHYYHQTHSNKYKTVHSVIHSYNYSIGFSVFLGVNLWLHINCDVLPPNIPIHKLKCSDVRTQCTNQGMRLIFWMPLNLLSLLLLLVLRLSPSIFFYSAAIFESANKLYMA